MHDHHGQPLPYMRQLLDALAFYPDDEMSFQLCRQIIEAEHREYLRVGSTDYRTCRVTEVLINAAENRATRVHVAGLVALAMLGLKATNQRDSTEAAIRKVSELNYQANTFAFERFDNKAGELRQYLKKVQGHPDSIRKIFYEYRSVSHVCAARIVSTDYLEPMPIFEPAPEADASRLATVLAFQSFFQREVKASDEWGLRLLACPPGFFETAAVLEPLAWRMEELMGSEG